MPSVRSGKAVYPVRHAAQYIFTVLVGRYLGLLSKEVLLNCLQRVHAFVRTPLHAFTVELQEASPAHPIRTAAVYFGAQVQQCSEHWCILNLSSHCCSFTFCVACWFLASGGFRIHVSAYFG